MDPNETLRRLRKLLDAEAADDGDPLHSLVEASELFEALDGWLSNGGVLPRAWERR